MGDDATGSVSELEKRALALLGDGKAEEARGLLEQALAMDPQSAGCHGNLGVALQALGRFAEAIVSYRRATSIVGDQLAIIHYNLGTALAESGQLDEAAGSYEQALASKPGWATALDNLGTVMQRLGRAAEAEQYYGESLAADPANPDARCNLGALLCATTRYAEAEAVFREVLAAHPDFARAHSGLGAALSGQGHGGDAVLSLRRALELDPDLVDPHRLLADVLAAAGDHEQALAHAERACALRPDEPYCHSMRGGILLNLGRAEEAVAAYRQARAIAPHLPEVHLNVGIALEHAGDHEGAVASYREGLVREPKHVPSLTGLASALGRQGKIDEAVAAYEKLLEVHPEHPAAAHMIAALRGEATAVAPQHYVSSLFDGYAGHFDEHMRGKLEYRVPALLHEALSGSFANGGFERALDLGCGTGLIGSVLRTWVVRLDGIDLSPQMIEKARAKQIYDDLQVAEIIAHLGAATEPRYDLVTAGDVFCYVGDLVPFLTAIRARIATGGLFAFTCERSDSGEFVLQSHGRYAHSQAYIESLAADGSGWELMYCETAELRREVKAPVPGWVCVMRAS